MPRDEVIKAEVINFEPGCVGIYLDWKSGRISAYSVSSMTEADEELKRLGVSLHPEEPWTAEDIEDLEIGYIQGLGVEAVAHHLDREVTAVCRKAAELGLVDSPSIVPGQEQELAPAKRIEPA
jgi:hypothetical protein